VFCLYTRVIFRVNDDFGMLLMLGVLILFLFFFFPLNVANFHFSENSSRVLKISKSLLTPSPTLYL
jgi:hypothetical protein